MKPVRASKNQSTRDFTFVMHSESIHGKISLEVLHILGILSFHKSIFWYIVWFSSLAEIWEMQPYPRNELWTSISGNG